MNKSCVLGGQVSGLALAVLGALAVQGGQGIDVQGATVGQELSVLFVQNGLAGLLCVESLGFSALGGHAAESTGFTLGTFEGMSAQHDLLENLGSAHFENLK